MNNRTLCLEDDDHNFVDFRGEILTIGIFL